MKISTAIRNAWRGYTSALGDTLKFLLTEGCLTLICLVPLLFLTSEGLSWLAWLTPACWIFLMLPLRMNAAQAMEEKLRGGRLATSGLVSLEDYGRKLLCGLKRVGLILLWALPLIALAVVGKIHFSGEVDSFTVLRMIRNDLGGGDQMRGILVVLFAVLAALLLFMLGCAFHSGARHAYAQGDRTLVQGHHGGVTLNWLASLLSILPILLAVLIVIFRYLPALSDLNGLLMKTVALPSTRGTIVILGVGAVLTLPLLPLRSLIHAAYVEGLKKA